MWIWVLWASLRGRSINHIEDYSELLIHRIIIVIYSCKDLHCSLGVVLTLSAGLETSQENNLTRDIVSPDCWSLVERLETLAEASHHRFKIFQWKWLKNLGRIRHALGNIRQVGNWLLNLWCLWLLQTEGWWQWLDIGLDSLLRVIRFSELHVIMIVYWGLGLDLLRNWSELRILLSGNRDSFLILVLHIF